MTVAGKPQPPPALSGADFSFSFIDPDGQARAIRGKFDGDKFDGWMRFATYDTRVSGQRATQAPAK